jgi:hypothetical protein
MMHVTANTLSHAANEAKAGVKNVPEVWAVVLGLAVSKKSGAGDDQPEVASVVLWWGSSKPIYGDTSTATISTYRQTKTLENIPTTIPDFAEFCSI